jgi:phosphonate transport system ATP-binding protein
VSGADAAVPLIDARGFDVAVAGGGAARPVLHGLDLRIDAGEQVAVIGASGAGKTTLLMALATGVWPAAGQLRLAGVDPWAVDAAARRRLRTQILLAPQVPPLPPRQRVVTAVLAARLGTLGGLASLRQLVAPPAAAVQQVHDALTAFDLPDKLWQRVDRLSGGERQRVGLARLLVSDAALWLVDEPLSALDPARAERVMRVLCERATRQRRTLVCSLHQIDVARRCFPRVVALREGRIVHDGPAADLDEARLRALYGADLPAMAAAPVACATPVALSQVPPQAMCR